MADSRAKQEWERDNTVLIAAKLNKRTDADIIEALGMMTGPTAARVKALIRKGIAADAEALRKLTEE